MSSLLSPTEKVYLDSLRSHFHSGVWRAFSNPNAIPISVRDFDLCGDLLDALQSIDFVRSGSSATIAPQRWLHFVSAKSIERLESPVFLFSDLPPQRQLANNEFSVFPYSDEGHFLVNRFSSYIRELPRKPRVLDLFSGMGTIAVLVSKLRPDAKIVACDNSPRALKQASINCYLNGIPEHSVEFRCGDVWGPVHEGEEFDFIVADPPFTLKPNFVYSTIPDDGGEFGDLLTRRILADSHRFMAAGDHVRLAILTYCVGNLDQTGIRLSDPPDLIGSFSRAGDRVWRFEHRKAFRNPMPLEYLILRLGDGTKPECIIGQSPDQQTETIANYIEWIDRLKSIRLLVSNGRSQTETTATHLHYLVGEFRKRTKS